jgi:predicted ATPase
MDLVADDYALTRLDGINVILGKNGCGKSTLLKRLEAHAHSDEIGKRKYVTPERGGVLTYEGNVEQTIVQNPNWMSDTRRVNQFGQFRQQSVAQFRRLETLVHRESEERGEVSTFAAYMQQLNGLLDNIELRREPDGMTFRIYLKATGDPVDATMISSGESELVSLGIEILMFAKEAEPGKENLLFLDEPDVHLHPDLQARLAEFLIETVTDHGFRVVLATHSTAILGALTTYQDAAVAFMRPGDRSLEMEPISAIHRRILPVFGAHPLSNIFNEAPVIVVEGDDDERVWQQAVRTSNGKLKLYPVACDGVTGMSDYEQEVRRIVESVYDNGTAYTLRDGDGVAEELDDLGPVVRLRLACRAAENLLLTEELLEATGASWEELVKRIEAWIAANKGHPRYEAMVAFRTGGFDRRNHDLKQLRMLLVGQILASDKPWEVLVGQAIGRRVLAGDSEAVSANSLDDFLGQKVMSTLLAGS